MKIIISESQYNLLFESKLKQNLKQEIKDFGIKDTAELVNGLENLCEILNINSPMEFLHLFNDLDVVQSEEKPNWTLFRYKPKHNLMIHDKKSKIVYINYEEIWKPLLDVGLFNPDIKELIKEWLFKVYNLRGVTPLHYGNLYGGGLFEVYNIRK
jgi:hypothetical protein